MEIKSVKIKGFKKIKEASFSLAPISLVIGGNNSGKSSVLQGIHFAITTLQSAKSAGAGSKAASTLGFDQFIYKPAGDLFRLYNGGRITQTLGPEFYFSSLPTGKTDEEDFSLVLRRGKNSNIATNFEERKNFFNVAADRARPLSIFFPGLAGVPLREEKRTPSVVSSSIAQGDSNVFLRNILLKIIEDAPRLAKFHKIINSIFPGVSISSNFDENVHLYIEIYVNRDGVEIPLEMVGTGCLQAIQLVAYVTAYNPTLLLLDEPDAHLHASNQRLLAATLKEIVASTSTKIILATHSRHIYDSLAFDLNDLAPGKRLPRLTVYNQLRRAWNVENCSGAIHA